ncbi:sensor domain-containing diguanylate cyclase [Actinoplanes subtropicus]|uniref:sensor domain-containing diguanylate cyclase n=1 Tax=Actinoplanes subtropicus TaxID=543632 RepID=UPI00068B0F00|nr:sensor domain-containing diguanylate cyclase [Actinoplanes subtropicus]
MRQIRGLFADPVLGVLGLLGVLAVPWFLTGAGGSLSSWAVQCGIDLANLWLCTRLYRLPGNGRHGRRFWAAVSVAMACSTVADSYQTMLVVSDRATAQGSTVQTGLVAAGMVVVVVTMLFHPLGGAGRQRLRMWLDAATVLTAVAAFLWYFMLAGAHLGERLASAVTAAVMLLVTFGLIKLIYSDSAPFDRAPGIIGALGVTGTAVCAPIAMMLTGQAGSPAMYLAQLVPCLLLPVSLRLQERSNRRQAGPRVAAERKGFSRLPYAAVAGTQLLLVGALPTIGAGIRIWGVAAGALISTGLVLARQQAAFHDNERLVTELGAGREWFSALVQQASDLIVVVGTDDMVQYASPAAERVLGVVAGLPAADTIDPRIHLDDRPALDALNRELAGAATAEAELRFVQDDGTHRWLHVIATDLRDNPSVRGVVWNSRDITEARQLQDELRHQATHDVLTGLANRVLLQQRVRQAAPDAPISILLLDLDGFKQVNDGLGHHAGDEVLIAVARRVTAVLGRAGTVARLGGDEFAVLLPGADPDRARVLADLIAAAVAEPIPAAGTVVTVGASVGVATGPPADAERLLRAADEEMYRTKQARRTAA